MNKKIKTTPLKKLKLSKNKVYLSSKESATLASRCRNRLEKKFNALKINEVSRLITFDDEVRNKKKNIFSKSQISQLISILEKTQTIKSNIKKIF